MKTEMSTVGRPKAIVTIPEGKFTFQEFCAANKHVAHLTIRNFLKEDRNMGKKSQILRIEDERGEPGSTDGYGRKPFLYVRRDLLGKLGVRNVGYHVTLAKAPRHVIKRTELANGKSHHHRVVNVGKLNGGASVTISFAALPQGAPIPTSVTVNFQPRSKTSTSNSITIEPNDHPKELPETTPTTPCESSSPIAAPIETLVAP